jgi:hypothetical protein
MWFWTNSRRNGYYSEQELKRQLDSFSEPVPHNNHIPQKFRQLVGVFPGSTLEEERELVAAFLRRREPYFTWNGDTDFWQSAARAVGSAFDVLKGKKSDWTIGETGKLTGVCLKFLVDVGGLLPESTVGLSQQGEFDMLELTREGSKWLKHARLEPSSDHAGPDRQEAEAVSNRTERTLQQGQSLGSRNRAPGDHREVRSGTHGC